MREIYPRNTLKTYQIGYLPVPWICRHQRRKERGQGVVWNLLFIKCNGRGHESLGQSYFGPHMKRFVKLSLFINSVEKLILYRHLITYLSPQRRDISVFIGSLNVQKSGLGQGVLGVF